MSDEWLSLKEAADTCSVSVKTLRRWIASGRLPASRLGPKLIRVRPGDLASLAHPATDPDRPDQTEYLRKRRQWQEQGA